MYDLRPMRALAILVLTLAACGGRSRVFFVRVMAEDGRVYYARKDKMLHSPAGGFLAFRDLVTREDVHLKNGSYRALECPESEIEVRQEEYMNDPTRVPTAKDYEVEPR